MTNVDRKALQLCRQVERTLGLVLAGELNDDRVRDLLVLSVVPAPHSNHLLVTLQAAETLSQEELLQLDQALFEHKGHLRSAIAADISRRKTPDITLRVINPI
jgi:ribosome-binding factor A